MKYILLLLPESYNLLYISKCQYKVNAKIQKFKYLFGFHRVKHEKLDANSKNRSKKKAASEYLAVSLLNYFNNSFHMFYTIKYCM